MAIFAATMTAIGLIGGAQTASIQAKASRKAAEEQTKQSKAKQEELNKKFEDIRRKLDFSVAPKDVTGKHLNELFFGCGGSKEGELFFAGFRLAALVDDVLLVHIVFNAWVGRGQR